MTESLIKTMTIKSWLSNLNFTSPDFSYQSDHQFLTDETIRLNRGKLTANDVLCINTGNFTGKRKLIKLIYDTLDSKILSMH